MRRTAHTHSFIGRSGRPRRTPGNHALEALPQRVRSVNIGFTGLSPAHEGELMGRLTRQPGGPCSSAWRWNAPWASRMADLPAGCRTTWRSYNRAVTVEALADLDFRSVHGTVDELLIGDRVESPRDRRADRR